ncbi:hypothetical protein ACA910_004085 [Epithemia clementina (nom. ined.)]
MPCPSNSPHGPNGASLSSLCSSRNQRFVRGETERSRLTRIKGTKTTSRLWLGSEKDYDESRNDSQEDQKASAAAAASQELERQLLQLQYLSHQFENFLLQRDKEEQEQLVHHRREMKKKRRNEMQRQEETLFASRLERLQSELEAVEQQLYEETNNPDQLQQVGSSTTLVDYPDNDYFDKDENEGKLLEGTRLRWGPSADNNSQALDRPRSRIGRGLLLTTDYWKQSQSQLQALGQTVTRRRTAFEQALDQAVDQVMYHYWPNSLAVLQQLQNPQQQRQRRRNPLKPLPPAKLPPLPLFTWQAMFQVLPRACVDMAATTILFYQPLQHVNFQKTLFLRNNAPQPKAVSLSLLLPYVHSAVPLSDSPNAIATTSSPFTNSEFSRVKDTRIVWKIPMKLTAAARKQLEEAAAASASAARVTPFFYPHPKIAQHRGLEWAQLMPCTTWPSLLEKDSTVTRFLKRLNYRKEQTRR